MNSIHYDYAIIGAGAAGLQLAMRMAGESFFSGKSILLIDKDEKVENDRTWCFWEKSAGKWDAIVFKQWEKASFQSDDLSRVYDLTPYRYKMIRGADFYKYAKDIIKSADNIHWVRDEVLSLREEKVAEIECTRGRFTAGHVFDSRIDPSFFTAEDSSTRILQHFKGWLIKTEESVFDPGVFTMMDFRLQWKDSTSFTYILPFSKNSAMVEFTLFTPELIADEDYDKMLETYLDTYLPVRSYTITEVEKGVIPMSDFPFHRFHGKYITKIGTAGGWVKPSSGYSFRNCEKYSGLIIDALKEGRDPSANPVPLRFRFYDRIFLDVLNRQNELGEMIFTDMYANNPIQRIFRFLDNETEFSEELKVIASFETLPFLQAFFRQITR